MAQPILYSYYRSSCSWRVRAALDLKGIKYETKCVNLLKDGGEQRTDAYKAINPMGQVPALVIDGNTLIQSMSILEYLEETRPSLPLLPKEPLDRAKVRAVSECITSGIQPLQNLSLLQKLTDIEMRKNWINDCICKGFFAVEKLLQNSAGKYCVGDTITFADLCLVPQVYNANRYRVDLEPFPLISKINDVVMEHEGFIKSHPANQPDCPEHKGNITWGEGVNVPAH